jgi:hypothetical protein
MSDITDPFGSQAHRIANLGKDAELNRERATRQRYEAALRELYEAVAEEVIERGAMAREHPKLVVSWHKAREALAAAQEGGHQWV